TASVDGPLSALRTHAYLAWGKLNSELRGTLNAQNQQADWQISTTAPAMQAHAHLGWQSLSILGTLQGELSKPSIHANVDMKGLRSSDMGIGHVNLSLQGNTGQLELTGAVDKLTLAGTTNDLLQAQTLNLQAGIRLDQAQRPVTLKLQHPLFTVSGDALTSGQVQAQLLLDLPNLKPLAALSGLDLAGNSKVGLKARQLDQASEITLDGGLAITGGDPVLVKLLGKQTSIAAAMSISGADMDLSCFQLNGKAITVQADGGLKNQLAQFNWQVGLNDLGAIAEKISGKLVARGLVSGPLDDFTALADVSGDMATHSFPRQPVAAKVKVEHLPNQAIGQLNAHTVLAGSPLELAMDVKPQNNQSLQFNINRADWKSLHTQGSMNLAKQSVLPIGNLAITVKRLEDFRILLGQPLSGALTATLKTARQGQQTHAYLNVAARNTGLSEDLMIAGSTLKLTIRDPINKPHLDGQLKLEGLAIGELSGVTQLDFNGTPNELGLQLSACLDNLAGAPLEASSKARFSAANKEIEINDLHAVWKKQSLRLLAPASIALSNGLAIKQLRLGLDDAIVQADGQISPKLDITASLQKVSLALLKLLKPDLKASGTVSADAKLQGSIAQPIGTLAINGSDMRLLSGNGDALPAAQFDATAELDGSNAQIQAKLKAGENAELTLSGLAPLNADGLFDLKTTGTIELKLFDPLLTANGRRVRGQIAIDGGLVGTLAEPQVTGTARLTKVEIRDYAIGANLTAINGLITAKGGQLLVDKLQAQAGKGTIDVKGSIDLLKTGVPVNLTLTAKEAKPLASDRLTVNLDADLSVRGLAAEELLVLGAIKINRADIRIPEYLPANIAVLKLQTPENQAPPPATANSVIKLNLIISAADEIFVRGRGVDAELNGTVGVRGTVSNPRPDGGFKLRRGQFTLGGKTLTFSQGKVGFDSGRLTDPSLNFVANTSSDNITATLTISGTANKPKISLSSVPDLPQDEILARLLFSRSASSLSVLEIVQIGSAVATLSGATSGFGDPLDSVRQTLGLDRLTVGGKNTSVEAGSYVAPGIYLGTRQGLSGGPQATIQIDLTKHIKLEAAVGASSTSNKNANPNSLGVIYQYEY
ncbi:translocation/assembly module TamB domain-containing protein, partial [Methylovulum sp.]